MDSLSAAQARKLILLSQSLPPIKNQRSTATLRHLQHLGYVQIDTISVVQRAHHHTFWSRNPNYHPKQLDNLVSSGQAFEYWSHAAAYLPMECFRHSLPRKEAIANGELDHWYPRDQKEITEVLARIHAEGPLKARDFEHDNRHKKVGEWHHKPAKRALTYLFMQGELMCARREGFQMVYDLRDRVLPPNVDTRLPSKSEHARHLINSFLAANGIAQLKDVSYLRKGLKPDLFAVSQQMREAGELIDISINKKHYLTTPQQLTLLDKRLSGHRACILSPFDNLLIQRHRMSELFEFDYQIECYTPAAKRLYGYFVLPVLWRGKLVARLDCKADRKNGVLILHSLHAEAHLRKIEEFTQAFSSALLEFCTFNHCRRVSMDTLPNTPICTALKAAMQDRQ